MKVVAANRRAWSRYSEERKAVLWAARRERLKFKKDGTASVRPEVTYKCAGCGEYFPMKEVQVDHREPVGETAGWPPGDGRSWDDWLAALWCDEVNLQVLCKNFCHKLKTKEEMKERAKRNRP